MFKYSYLFAAIVIGLLASCGREKSSEVEAKNEIVETLHPLINFLEGKWVYGNKDGVDRTNSSSYLIFEGSKLVLFSSEKELLNATFKITDHSYDSTNYTYLEVSYKQEITEDDPFGELGSIETVTDYFKFTKHSDDCIELDLERDKIASIFLYRDKK